MTYSQRGGIILYDYLQVRGGAELVTLALAAGIRDADLCVGFINRKQFDQAAIEAQRIFELRSYAPTVPGRILRTARLFAHRTEFLRDYRWVLYSGYYAPLAVRNHPVGRNVLYCYTIPRFAYDLQEYYLQRSARWQRPLLHKLIHYIRPRYESAVRAMDCVIADSENVRARIARYLHVDSQVIYPPCQIEGWHWEAADGYFLSTARLEPYKRVALIVEAFLSMPDKRLVVVSAGSEYDRLKKLARRAQNIQFTGWVDAASLHRLLARAIATIYIPVDEDFGMSPVESMAAGKPVIGVAEGGVLETVVPASTGLLVPASPGVDDVVAAVSALTVERAAAMREACQDRARLFGAEAFWSRLLPILDG